MDRQRVLFLDSGLGGLPYTAATRREVPHAQLLYVADRAFYPYGERASTDLIARLLELTARVLSKLRPELVVLACNTASVTALESLRARFDVPFIGVVPAVKPAARASAGRRIGVLSTSGTARAGYLSDLIAHHADGCAVELFPAADLVDWVETQMPLDGDGGSMDLLEHSISSIRAARIDQLVLGCTHFLYLKRTLQRALGESVQVVDSTDGVARQVRRVVGDLAAAPGRDRLYVTAEGTWQDRYLQAASSFSFAYAGVL